MAREPTIKTFLIAAALAVSAAGTATAQSASDTETAMRTLAATPMDIADGKQLANTSCARCHGADGIGSAPYMPSIAGQRPAYLYLSLKDYASGVRADAQMREAIKFLSDDALIKVSAYYAGLDPAETAPGGVPPARPDALQAGQKAAAACTGCHGATGVTAIPGIPSLISLDTKYLVEAMADYKTGKRKNDTMKAMLASLNDKAIADVALFFALQTPARAKTNAQGNAAAGKAAAASCGGCHGETGVSGSPATPSLAGQDAQYLVAALTGYKDGTRSNDTMKGMVAALDATAMKNLAAFYTAQQPKMPNVRKPVSTSEWAARCNRCHGFNGNSSDPRLPMLASQRADYLQKSLMEYREHKRKSSAMVPMAEGLTVDEVANLAGYYAQQKARAVLFVPMPAK